ncbi:hypothetical protein NZK33_15610 [Cyanobium sp. FGCU-6]|nr:hypothetical protein [Cyanobium sp. FGCU6]
MQIRPYGHADWPAVWALLQPVFRAVETFPTTRPSARQKLRRRGGFAVVGTLSGAFRHRQLGCVDALVMIQSLLDGADQ